MNIRNISYICTVLLLIVFLAPQVVYAQDSDELKPDFEHFYEDLTMDKVAKLYWKLGQLDLNNDGHVDNFLMINECDIYKDYFFNEFEWSTVRNRAKVFLKENTEDFPVRFKYVQPLRLTEYNDSTGMFAIHEDYQVKGYRKFEVMTNDFADPICNIRGSTNIPYYPRLMLVEFTQPLTLKEIPLSPQRAEEYVQDKMSAFNTLIDVRKTKQNLYAFRDAYIVMKIKMFSYKGQHTIMNGWERAEVYGMLEGYEIYADRDHTKLLYFENYIRDQDDKRPVNVKLKEQYEALRRKRGDIIEEDQGASQAEEEPVDSLMDLKKAL